MGWTSRDISIRWRGAYIGLHGNNFNLWYSSFVLERALWESGMA